ncbi:MAG: aminotransferase class I/II-fold pyridoxal phosphate-dependent enzyme, partial [FCB group bacterium]|nr:aminotransferase class I/II-fold pyridoxal phosphate-dependent enzyme [FCB group bacterium]
MENISLSSYGSLSTTPSPVNRMMASFAADFRDGFDINLGVGYVNDKTIPQREILAAMEAVINDPVHYRIAFNYGNPAGSVNLIDSLKRFIVANHIGGITDEILDKKKMVIGASGVTSLLEGIAQVMKPGIVVTTDPMYYIYCEFLERAGFTVLSVPEDAHGIRTDLIEDKIAGCLDDISFFYVVTIGNPTSS